MRFDRSALGGGLYVAGRMENGKAAMEFTVCLTGSLPRDCGDDGGGEYTVEILMLDREGAEVAAAVMPAPPPSCLQEGQEDCTFMDTIKSLLIYPHLWKSVEDPYLYTVRASLFRDDELTDELTVSHALRTFSRHPTRGFLLNEAPFPLRAVRYHKSLSGDKGMQKERLENDFKLLLEMGANAVCVESEDLDAEFVDLCEHKGLLIWCGADGRTEEDLPVWDDAQKGLITADRRRKTDLFYYYKACWGSEPFVHLCRPEFADSLESATVRVYSNQKKAALYVDGQLFEWKESAPCFCFEEVPLPGRDTVLSVQTGNLYAALTVRKNR